MRRADREIRDNSKIVDVMRRSQVVTLGLFDQTAPYLLPVNFGMEPDGMTLYVHGAVTGTKYALLERNDHVGFNMVAQSQVVLKGTMCTTCYESISGWGIVDEITDPTGKMDALHKILEHYDHGDVPVDESVAAQTRVLRLRIQERTGKKRRMPG